MQAFTQNKNYTFPGHLKPWPVQKQLVTIY